MPSKKKLVWAFLVIAKNLFSFAKTRTMIRNNKKEATFEGFPYPASRLKRFIQSAGLFTLSIKPDMIVHHLPDDAKAFREWLIKNGVEDIKG
jgi:polyferredoxin